MANISQIKKIRYTITATDAINGYVLIPVLWKSPFNDTNYAMSVVIESVTPNIGVAQGFSGYSLESIIKVTSAGFTANIGTYNTFVAGEVVVVHAIASHQ
jgi:hypothetical protein